MACVRSKMLLKISPDEFEASLLAFSSFYDFFYVSTQMSKLTKDLKRENTFLKSKCEKSDFTLIELVEEVIPRCLTLIQLELLI